MANSNADGEIVLGLQIAETTQLIQYTTKAIIAKSQLADYWQIGLRKNKFTVEKGLEKT